MVFIFTPFYTFRHTFFKYLKKGDEDTGRENAHHVDLNRNFPDQFDQFLSELDEDDSRKTSRENLDPEPETLAVMHWMKQYPFVLSANLHGGSLVANYPFDDNPEMKVKFSPSPDDSVFHQLALTYSKVAFIYCSEYSIHHVTPTNFYNTCINALGA